MPFAQLASDLRMHYEIDDFTDPWTTPEFVLLHHGNAKNSGLFYRWIPVVARRYRVVRLDARGFGQTSVPLPGYPWSLEQFARDIQALLDYLSIRAVHFVGESVGGTIGLQFAYQHPDRLKSLTVCGSPYKFVGQPGFLESAKRVAAEGTLAWAKASMGNRVGANADPSFAGWYANEMGKTKPHVVSETLQALSKVDLTPVLPKIKAPTLLLTSGDNQNQIDSLGEAQKLIPNCRLVALPGASGFVQHTAPERCAQECMNFWRSL